MGVLHHLFHAALKFLVLALFVVVPFVLALPGQEEVGIPGKKLREKKLSRLFSFSHFLGRKKLANLENKREGRK
jgi:hypothetical protein